MARAARLSGVGLAVARLPAADAHGAAGLGQKLADSPAVTACVAKHWFRFANGRHEEDGDEKDLDAVTAEFDAADGDVRVLMKAIVQSDAFRLRRIQ